MNMVNRILGPDIKLLQSMALLKPPGIGGHQVPYSSSGVQFRVDFICSSLR